ncbi:MAG: hypothetical protein HFH15_03130 [Ruminococcus sp.]|nr:hypothetical protein [Ruminococcus sp.]
MVWEELERLAKDYLPEWRISRESPDVGGVIALIYADLVEKTLEKYQEMPARAIQKILQMSGIRPAPASPARTILVMEIDRAAKEGILIRKGSRFLADLDNRDAPIVFCTEQELLAIQAELTDILQISQKNRTIYAGKCQDALFPLSLFHMEKEMPLRSDGALSKTCACESIYQEELVISHPGILKEPVRIPRAVFDGTAPRYLGARIQAYGMEIRPQVLYDGNQELGLERAAVFGRELQEYKECYIGHDSVFQQGGARIDIHFTLQFETYRMQPDETEDEWKVIKRKPKEIKSSVPVYMDEVAYSYYNGVGWKRLELLDGMADVFSRAKDISPGTKDCHLVFVCPYDWRPVIIGGQELRCLRIQAIHAGCSWRMDAEYHYPVLADLRLSYSHDPSGILPQKTVSIQGTVETELTHKEQFGYYQPGVPMFQPFPYDGESMLFGFDRVFPSGNISLYLMLGEQKKNTGVKIQYEYSAQNGFEPLEVVDTTECLSRSGTVMFWLPENSGMLEVEGRKRFWIRMKLSGSGADGTRDFAPCLHMIYLNGAEAFNYEWSESKDYYLDEPVPFLECMLEGEQILEAEVMVNEKEVLSEKEMLQLLDGPWGKEGRVHMEKDYRGKISEFYVKWPEVENFECEQESPRGYVLDRQNKKIKFGDGRVWKIPECSSGTAFCVRVKTCDGRAGNLSPMQSFHPAVSQTFLKRAYQPGHASGGCDAGMQSKIEQRGTFLRNSMNRLVSAKDYVSEIRTFSEQIAEVKLIKTVSGREKLVVLMKDYKDGPASYWQIKPILHGLIQEKRALADGEEISIEKPIFVQVSIEVWGACPPYKVIEAKQRLKNKIQRFFEPEDFWRIGKLPERIELETMLRAGDVDISIQYFNAVFQYEDSKGIHKWNLDHKISIPEGVCMNGKHTIHLGGKELVYRRQAI